MALNYYGQEDDPDGLMVPEWAQQATEAPPVQIQAPQGGLDALANVGQGLPPGEAPMEGPAEMPGDRTPAAPDLPLPADIPPPPMPIADAPPAVAPAVPKLADATAQILQPPVPGSVAPTMPAGADKMHVAQKLQSPEMETVNKNVDAITQAKITAEKNDLAVKNAKAIEEQKFAEDNAKRQAAKEERLAALMKDHDERLAQATAKNTVAYEEAKNYKFHDYWSDKTTGDRIIAALSVFLGGLGTAYGGENTANKNLQNLIAQDYQKQKDELQKKWDFAASTTKDVDRVQTGRAGALNDLNLRFAAATESAAAERANMLAKYGTPDAQIAADKKILDLQAEGEKFKQTSAKDTEQTVSWETKRKAMGGGGGGAGGSLSTLSAYIKDHPDDQPGQYAMAEKIGYHGPKAAALVDKLQNDFKKGTEPGGANETKLIVRDDKGNPIGMAPRSANVHTIATRDSEYARAADQLERLQKDIEEHGERVFTPEAVKRRETLKKNANIAVATVSPLGKTDEAMKLESASIGGSGSWSLMGANPDALKVKIEELKTQRQRYRNSELTPLTDQPAPSGAKTGGGEGTKPDATTPRPEPSRQAKAAAASRVMSDPNAPPLAKKRAKEYLQSLGN